MARTRKSILAEAGRRFGSNAVQAVQTSAITRMRDLARILAIKLRDQAGDIERAANIIASIAGDDSRSELIDGPLWEQAEKTLKAAGLAVPRSADYTWVEAPSQGARTKARK